jgi:hypothetical protein
MILDPYRASRLVGAWNLHVVQVVLPVDNVLAMLPPGITLAPQQLTPPGTHPVRLYFTAGLHAILSWPPGIDMLYNEQCVGVPFVNRVAPMVPGAQPGPYYYMPRLWLDNWVPTSGGLLFWGYEKRLADIAVTTDEREDESWTTYAVRDRMTAMPQITARWRELSGDPRSVYEEPNFVEQMRIMDQPVVSEIPWSLGPYQALANFRMTWRSATIRGIEAEVDVYEPFVPGMPVTKFPKTSGIGVDPLGSYVLSCPWELSLAYSADLADWFQLVAAGSQRLATG